jgi:hypothetical protein
MRDLEEQIARVVNAEVRPLVREAHRCYTAGAARAAIVLTWTAVCADLIDKIATLQQSGESEARELTAKVESAQGKLDRDSVHAMQEVEGALLETALKLELIDVTQQLHLERLRQDRNLCAHSSLRPLGELFDPPLEYARAHLFVALDAVLVHPASQGRTVVKAFAAHVLDSAFVGDQEHIAHAFFRQVRPATRRRVVEFAAKHAMLEPELPDHPAVAPADLADRMARCLKIFATEDRELVGAVVSKFADQYAKQPVSTQCRVLARLGDLDAFWAGLGQPMRSQLDAIVREIGETQKGLGPWEEPSLGTVEAEALALAAIDEVRVVLPSLGPAVAALPDDRRPEVIAKRPSVYFADQLASTLTAVFNFDMGAAVARTAVLPCAPYLTLEQLQRVLAAWSDNAQCWGRYMTDYAVQFYFATDHLGTDRNPAWSDFLDRLAAQIGSPSPVNYQWVFDELIEKLGGYVRGAA